MVVEIIHQRKQYRLNNEDIQKLKELFGITDRIKTIQMVSGEDFMDIVCEER